MGQLPNTEGSTAERVGLHLNSTAISVLRLAAGVCQSKLN